MLFKHIFLQYFQDIPPPSFISRPEDLWSEEEKKTFEDYEKKVKELNEDKEKYREVNWNEDGFVHSAHDQSSPSFSEATSKNEY